MTPFASFTRQTYLNLETFRKSGAGVRTPVWFVQTGDTIYIRTAANSGKVKRIRNNHQVNIAPCKMNGDPLGEWLPALAARVSDQETIRQVDRLLNKKYGLMKKLFGLASVLQHQEDAILEIKVKS